MGSKRAILSALLSFLIVVFATSAIADPSPKDVGGPLPWQNTGSGNWGGARSYLAEHGFTFLLQNDTYGQYNAVGGRRTGWGWENRLTIELNLQFEPLVGLKGSELQVSGAWNIGNSINDEVGSIIEPATIYRENAVRLYELYWGQYFIDKQVHFKIGRLGLGPFEYCYSVFMLDFMSAGYSSSPGGIFLDQPVTTFAFPIATWGARIAIVPKSQDFMVKMGVYNGWPRDLARGDANGVDFSINLNKSVFLIGEFAYQLNQDEEDSGLPGNYKIGFMYDTGPFTRFDRSGEEKRGNFGLYVIADQMFYRESSMEYDEGHPANWKVGYRKSHPTDQGLYGWLSFIVNPDDSINIAPYWLSAGLTYKGLIPTREADRLGVGFYHAFFSPDIGLSDETQIELFYRCQITSWLGIGPDFQYFINPAGASNDKAFVLGLNLQFLL